MDTNKMREQFEAGVMAKWPGIRMLRVNRPGSPVDGEYELPGLEGAWWGWQASRDAVVVELPSRPHASEEEQERMTDYEIGLGHGGCEEWDKIRDKIKAQGLKVKQ